MTEEGNHLLPLLIGLLQCSCIEESVQNPIELYAYTNTIIIEYEVTNDRLIINVIFGYNRSNMRTTALGCIVIIGDVLVGHITYGNYYDTVKLNQYEQLEWKSIKIEYCELNFSFYPGVKDKTITDVIPDSNVN